MSTGITAVIADVHGNLPALEAVLERWCAEQLDDEDRESIATFQPHLKLELAGLSVVAYHGSPASYDDPIRATTDDEKLDAYFTGFPAGLYLGAHTHEQFVRRYRVSVVPNPGSVGAAFVVPKGASQRDAASGLVADVVHLKTFT